MALAAGTRLGVYEIRGSLGSGGMGEVYRAHDSRLRREVAVKVLPSAFVSDQGRLARFEREARMLAALNHPHIGAIYGVEEVGGTSALILELVDGSTLADRIARGGLPIGEAVSIARQIADALEAAHEKGIIHRDLKPANIKITPGGIVKILDFGLAKAIADDAPGAEPPDASTRTLDGTRAGTVLGTARYMSPEQARGLAVDRRTDIWAFGCVLYEMLTGRPAFAGATLSDTIAAVLEREPDWGQVPRALPSNVRRVLQRCLEKDPKRRVRDIGDVRIDLEEPPPAEAGAARERRIAPSWPITAAILVAAAGIGAAVWIITRTGGDTTRLVTRTTVTLPGDQELDTTNRAAPLALSPDGRRLAYVAHRDGRAQLYLRSLDAFEAKPMPGTDGARFPFFSPDGLSVAFFTGGKLKRVPVRGGSPVVVCDTPEIGLGGTWGRDGTIVFDPGEVGLMRVNAAGGAPERLTSADPAMDARNLSWPHFMPDGRSLLATVGLGGQAILSALSLDTGAWHQLGPGFQGQYVPSGHVVFHAPGVREGELRVVGFDEKRLETRGSPASVLDGVFRSENGGGAYFAVAPTGTLMFSPGGHARTLVRVDRSGRRTPLSKDRRGFRAPDISPDGRRVAVVVDPRPSQIWVYDLARGSGIPLTSGGHSLGIAWTPDGRRVTFSTGGDMYVRPADASSDAERLLERPRAQYPTSWSRDGQFLVYSDEQVTNRFDIWVMPRNGEPRPLIATPAQELAARLSPDGRWLLYHSDESGRYEVYVRPFPNVNDAKWTISTTGGQFAVWSPTGRELFYRSGSRVMVVPVEIRGSVFVAGTPTELFSGPFETGSPGFDISPDGTFFVMVEADADAKPTQIHVILNWIEELPRVPAS